MMGDDDLMDSFDDFDETEPENEENLKHLLDQVNQMDNIFHQSYRSEQWGFDEQVEDRETEQYAFNESFGPQFYRKVHREENVRADIEEIIFEEPQPPKEEKFASEIKFFAIPEASNEDEFKGHSREVSEELKGFVKLSTTNDIDPKFKESVESGSDSEIKNLTHTIQPLAQIQEKQSQYFALNSSNLKNSKRSFKEDEANLYKEETASEMKLDWLRSNITNLKENLSSYIQAKKSKRKNSKKNIIKKMKQKLKEFQKENEALKNKLKQSEVFGAETHTVKSKASLSQSDFNASSLNASRKNKITLYTDDSIKTFGESSSTIKPMNFSFNRDDPGGQFSNSQSQEISLDFKADTPGRSGFQKRTSGRKKQEMELVGEEGEAQDLLAKDAKMENLFKEKLTPISQIGDHKNNKGDLDESQKDWESNGELPVGSSEVFGSLPSESQTTLDFGQEEEDAPKKKKKKKKKRKRKKNKDKQYAQQDQNLVDFARRNSLSLKQYFKKK